MMLFNKKIMHSILRHLRIQTLELENQGLSPWLCHFTDCLALDKFHSIYFNVLS